MSKVVMHNVRASYVNVFQPRGFAGQEAKYSLMLLIDKNHKDLKKLNLAVLDAAKDKFPKLKISDRLPGSLHNPVRDGDPKADETGQSEYEGCFFANCSSKRAPLVLGRDKTKLTEDDAILYSGCYVNVSLNTYGYDVSGNKGVALGLNGVQFSRDGEPLGGSRSVESDFEEIEEEEVDNVPF